jgi:hypothetical protein
MYVIIGRESHVFGAKQEGDRFIAAENMLSNAAESGLLQFKDLPEITKK